MLSTCTLPLTRPEIATKVANYVTDRNLIHAIRTEVFVHEQEIPHEVEVDRLDKISQHVLALYEGYPVGTGRLTPAGRIGRVAVVRPLRRQGVGLSVMRQLLALARQQQHQEVVLSAQRHAVEFYEKLGFEQVGNEYLDVGIVHVKMRKRLFLC